MSISPPAVQRSSWIPTAAEIMTDITYSPPAEADIMVDKDHWKFDVFDGYYWTRFTSNHWEVPIIACVLYLLMVFYGPSIMASRDAIRARPAVIAWNFLLSGFSVCGSFVTIQALLYGPHAGVLTHNFYVAVCSHPVYYGSGYVGMFMFLFIYSKLFEMVDTVFLTLRKNPVRLLHWYHHVSVLLYCWHSYSTRISSGLWFGAMNYLVHAFMYFYFAMTQINATTKAMVRPFAMCLTLLQLLQMVVGIAVTVASAVYSVEAKDGCHGNSTNTVLGLLMYFSYFVLFGHLFRQRYCVPQTKGKGVKKD